MLFIFCVRDSLTIEATILKAMCNNGSSISLSIQLFNVKQTIPKCSILK